MHFTNTINRNSKNISEALKILNAATQYAARPPRLPDGTRSVRVQPMPDAYRQAVEDFRLWPENISAREEDFKNGRTPRDRIQAN